MPVPLHKSIVHSMVSNLYILVPLQSFLIYFAIFFLIQVAIIQFSVIINVRSQHAVPVSVVRQWLDRQGSKNHQAVVKQSLGSGWQSVKKPIHNC